MKRILFVIMMLLAGNVARAQWEFVGAIYISEEDTSNIAELYGNSFFSNNNDPFVFKYLHERYRGCFRVIKTPEDSSFVQDYSHIILCDTTCFKNIGFSKLELEYINTDGCLNVTIPEACYAGQSLQRFDMLSYIDTIEIVLSDQNIDFYPPPLPNKVKVVKFINGVGMRSKLFRTEFLNGSLPTAGNLNTLEIHGFANYNDQYTVRHFNLQNPTLKKLIISGCSIDSILSLPTQLEHFKLNNNCYWTLIRNEIFEYEYQTVPNIFSIVAFPDSLKYLDLSNNILETIPLFTNKLEYIDITSNKLRSISAPPASVKVFIAGGIGYFPIDYNPDSLDIFTKYYSTFPITDLAPFPNGMDTLILTNLGFQKLGISIPNTLKYLNLNDNLLTQLPILPTELRNLIFDINGDSVALSVFNNYNLPNLEYFDFSYEKTSGTRQPLTIGLPSSIKSLGITSKWFSLYPAFPTELRSLSIADSFVTTLGKLPKNLSYLNVKECPALTCLPVLPNSLKTLETKFSCIPNYTDFIRTGTICNISKICDAGDYGRLGGKVFVDINNDGIFNGTDINIPQVIVSNYNPGNNFYSSTFTDGNYQMLLDTTGTNTLKITATPYLYTTLTPDSINVSPIGNTYLGNTYNFRMVPKPNINDLSIFVTADGTPPHPGFDAWAKIIAKNKGTVDVSNAEIKLVKPSDWTLVSSSINPTSVSGDTLIWKNQSMGKLVGTKDINLQFSIPQTAVLGTEYQIKGTVTPTVADSVPSDNVSIFNGIIVGSYDPNDKQVNPENLLPDYGDSTVLTYLIRFQNTGTFYAENVIITDSLPDNVDPATIEVKAASHPYTFSMHERGEIAFIFNGIMLPDSNTNEALSHGYVLFTVKPKKGLALGEKVENKAFIYFDYNDAIITNKAITTLKIETNIANRKELMAKIYPNPTSTATKIELSESVNGKVCLYNLQGAMISKTAMEDGKSTIETGTLQNGIYLIVIETEQGSAAAKLMVQH